MATSHARLDDRHRYLLSAFLAVTLLGGCGGDPDDSASGPTAASPTGQESEAADDFGICRLLTAEQVATVIPEHDGGTVASAGGSLIDGVDTYQCSYSAQRNDDFQIFTVIVTVAPTDELFEKIKPSGFAYGDDQAVDIGDGGWVSDDQDGDVHVKAMKGRKVVDLELLASDAKSRRDQIIALTRAIAYRL
jgi:hypothetical protein